jgi:hypothetical protein
MAILCNIVVQGMKCAIEKESSSTLDSTTAQNVYFSL